MRTSSQVLGAVLTALLVANSPAFAQVVQVPLAPTAVPQFVQELPRLGTNIPVVDGASPVDISMCEFQTSILPPGTAVAGALAGVAPLTWVWGYEAAAACPDPATPVSRPYIGPVVLAYRGTPTQVTYWNKLPDAATSNVVAYTASTDQTLQWADPFSLQQDGAFLNPYPGIPTPPWAVPNDTYELNDCNHAAKELQYLGLAAALPSPCANNYGFLAPQPTALSYIAPVPAAPHLHGGEIPAMLDGGPDAWWTPNGIYGHGYYSFNGAADAVLGKAVYTYPNVQQPAPTWFHDHVLGATRLNVYAGIAGAYYQVDPSFSLPTGMTPAGLNNGPPDPETGVGAEELLIPLVIQDRMFDTNGELLFPAVGINVEHPFWVPEFVGDVIVVNGKAWPTVTVEPKRYRFLVLNGSNARAYELFLDNPVTKVMGPSIWVIGNDQGYLDAPVEVNPNAVANNKLVVMPGERYEIIIDFGAQAGATLQMRNTARTPYPGGAVAVGNTTGKIVQFSVTAPCTGLCGAADTSYNPATLASIRTANPINRLSNPVTGTLALTAAGTPITVNQRRQLTLNEVMALGGPVEILMNNTTYTGAESAASRPFADFTPITTAWNVTQYSELPQEGETEIWEIVNITADAHPIHPHLVGFQILNRQKIDTKAYTAAYNLAFPGGGLDPATLAPYRAGVYIPGFGPPCDYDSPTTAGSRCAPQPKTKIPVGYMRPIGGNPDATFYLKGAVVPPAPAEQGWKDTAISYPGEVLRLLIRFAPTTLPNDTLAADAHYDFDPGEGHGYVWHCHIIDHEDNEMMRPFSVIPNPDAADARSILKGISY